MSENVPEIVLRVGDQNTLDRVEMARWLSAQSERTSSLGGIGTSAPLCRKDHAMTSAKM